eukprot:3201582-Amphidinium_carterae.1
MNLSQAAVARLDIGLLLQLLGTLNVAYTPRVAQGIRGQGDCHAEMLSQLLPFMSCTSHCCSCVVMDEFHYFADAERGSLLALESTVGQQIKQQCASSASVRGRPKTFEVEDNSLLLGLEDFGTNEKKTFLGTLAHRQPKHQCRPQDHTGRPLQLVQSDERPVPLNFLYSDSTAKVARQWRAAWVATPLPTAEEEEEGGKGSSHIVALLPKLGLEQASCISVPSEMGVPDSFTSEIKPE